MLEAHLRARDVIQGGPGDFPVGVTLAHAGLSAVPGGEERFGTGAAPRASIRSSRPRGGDDFVGVQTYSRTRFGADGPLGRRRRASRTLIMGYEFWPEALEGTIRYAARETRRADLRHRERHRHRRRRAARSSTYGERSPASAAACATASTCAATSTGRCSTTSSGSTATARGSAWSQSIERRSSGRPNAARACSARSRAAAASIRCASSESLLESQSHHRRNREMELLPLATEPFTPPTDRDMLPVRTSRVRANPSDLHLRLRTPGGRPGDVGRLLHPDRRRRAARLDDAEAAPRRRPCGATRRSACAFSTSAGPSRICRSTATRGSTTIRSSWPT